MKHAAVRLVDGTEIDPGDFYDRAGTILQLVRAVATASRHDKSFLAHDSWATHDACMGIATLAEALEQDLYAYFARRPSVPARRSKAPGNGDVYPEVHDSAPN